MIAFWILFVCLSFRRKCHLTSLSTPETTFPRIIGSGEFWCLDPLCIAAEGEELITLGAGSSMANCSGTSSFCLLCIWLWLSSQGQLCLLFCEMLIGIAQDAKKRIAINKFIFHPSEVAQNCFQHFRRCEFCWVVITTLYQLMQKSWYQETTQSLKNMLLWILWHNWLP